MSKPILCLDFDGVIHKYNTAWRGVDVIPDDATDGFWEWVEEAKKYFQIVVYSSRSNQEGGIEAMTIWLMQQRKKWREAGGKPPEDTSLEFQFAKEKPKAFLTIDDRALTFTGNWSDFPPEQLCNFRPWNKKT